MIEANAIGSAPALLRNFGCGTVLLLLPIVTNGSNVPILLLARFQNAASTFQAAQFALAALLVFACYFIGSLCIVLGEAIMGSLPNRYAAKEVELEADVIRDGSNELLAVASQFQNKRESLLTAVGFGTIVFAAQLGTAISAGWVTLEVRYLLLSALVALIAGHRATVLTHWFRLLFSLVAGSGSIEKPL